MAKRKRKRRTKADPARFSKKIITIVLLLVVIFTVTMTVVFIVKGSIPDTLVTAFFAFAGGEAGALGLIKFSETKYTTTGDSSTESGTDTDTDSSDAAG